VAERERDAMTTDAWLARYLPDVDNLRTALTWAFGPGGDSAIGVSLVSYSSEIWWDLSLEPERRHWLDLAASHVDEATSVSEKARIRLMALPAVFGRREYLAPALEAVAMFRQTGEILLLAQALRAAAMAVACPGFISEAEKPLDEAEAMLRRIGRSRALLSVLETKATIRKFAGDFVGARRVHEECLSLSRSYGAHRSMLLTQLNLAEIEFAEGRVDAAIACVRETCEMARRAGFQRYLAAASQNLAGYLLSVGEIGEARGAAREALEIKHGLETFPRLAPCVEHLGLAAAMDGDINRAARMAGYGDACYCREGRGREPTEQATWTSLGRLLASRLPPAERDRLMAEGAAWTDDQAIVAALGDG
jgi:tetratricopeptide (TPR) repeat protein